MDEAETLCDRVGIIQDGRLFALDTVSNLRALHGYEFKVTYARNGERGDLETLYGKDDQELVNRVQSMGIQQFSVSRTNLEDVYLALTGDKEALDGATN
jgi:ABC-2 type transport system ATP-binding protein